MPLPYEVLVLVFILGGVNLKLADLFDQRARGYIFATISAIFMGLLISDNSSASSIVLGIMLGVTLAGKVDQLNLVMGLCLSLATAIIAGFKIPNPFLLAIIAVTSLVDEIGHDKVASENILTNFFNLRMTLKITIILMAVLMRIDLINAIGFFCFDLSYDVISFIFDST